MSFMEELAHNLREARVVKRMTQNQLAQQIGVTANAISLYENAKRMPNLETMSIMSDVLGTSLDDLIPYVVHVHMTDVNQTCIFDLIGEKDGSEGCS